MRALSSMVKSVASLSLFDFQLGDRFTVRRIERGETRILNHRNIAILLQRDLAGNLIGRVREMPADIDIDNDIPVLTVFVDQGPIGMAALNFIMGHLRHDDSQV